MTKELIHIEDTRSQLHCDNPACGHVLPEGAVTWGAHLIGYPCPECGSDMLTRSDFEASEKMVRCVAWINKWFGWIGSEFAPADPKWAKQISIRNHDGKTIIKEEREQ